MNNVDFATLPSFITIREFCALHNIHWNTAYYHYQNGNINGHKSPNNKIMLENKIYNWLYKEKKEKNT